MTTYESDLTAAEPLPKLPAERFIPIRLRSGVYVRSGIVPADPHPFAEGPLAEATPTPDGPLPRPQLPMPTPVPFPRPMPVPIRVGTEELRLDIDGRFPTMTVSGVISGRFPTRALTWIARVKRTKAGTYLGPISYRDGTASLLPQTQVEVTLGPPTGTLTARATFTGAGAPPRTVEYTFKHSHFREVNFEFDTVADATSVTTYDTASHPNRPASLPAETLSIESTFGHAGIKVTRSGDSTIPVAGAGAGALWSDMEMHDAMVANWSRWADVPQWAMWVLFARQHEQGPSLGGIMFDDIGTAQRQGTAIFSQSFIANAPAGDPNPAAWVQRMKFWTAVHEIGHAFNLAHSWQKSLGTGWIPLADDPAARSYMNYPYNVPAAPGRTPEQSFFADFAFRFSEQELVFMRHAPSRFVQQGNAAWFDHHAFEETRLSAAGPLQLTARLHRPARFEFLEPVEIELKLCNTTTGPVIVDANVLAGDRLALIVRRRNGTAHELRPYARRCFEPAPAVLLPGESLYSTVQVSSDTSGFVVDEPGEYGVYAMLTLDEQDAFAAPLSVRVLPPASRDEERHAPDLLTADVGRVLAFNGSRVLATATDSLRDAAERFAGRRIALHAEAALGSAAARAGKVLRPSESGGLSVVVQKADLDAAVRHYKAAYGDLDAATDSFGHIKAVRRVTRFAQALADKGDAVAGAGVAAALAEKLRARGVKPAVVETVEVKALELKKAAKGK